jgi:hypothetical protein
MGVINTTKPLRPRKVWCRYPYARRFSKRRLLGIAEVGIERNHAFIRR